MSDRLFIIKRCQLCNRTFAMPMELEDPAKPHFCKGGTKDATGIATTIGAITTDRDLTDVTALHETLEQLRTDNPHQ